MSGLLNAQSLSRNRLGAFPELVRGPDMLSGPLNRQFSCVLESAVGNGCDFYWEKPVVIVHCTVGLEQE